MTMHDEPCPPLEELEAVLRLPPADPRRRHVEDCPRCRARVLTFLEFIEPPGDVPLAVLHEAESRLDGMLKRELALEGGRRTGASGSFPRRHAGWPPSRFVFPWAAAAFAVVALVLAVRALRPRGEAPVLLRGSTEHVAPGAGAAPALRSALTPAGLELSWSAVPGADAYEVRIYSPTLEEIARLRPTARTRVLLARADLPPSAAPGTAALWKVVALRAGDPLQESAPAELHLP
jgi:hypothetical protein